MSDKNADQANEPVGELTTQQVRQAFIQGQLHARGRHTEEFGTALTVALNTALDNWMDAIEQWAVMQTRNQLRAVLIKRRDECRLEAGDPRLSKEGRGRAALRALVWDDAVSEMRPR